MKRSSNWSLVAVVGLTLLCRSVAYAQDQHISDVGVSNSANAADNRNWALKSGPGAPHNILPGPPDARMAEESMYLRIPKLTADYVLGSGDRIDIRFVGDHAVGGQTTGLTVSNSGTITLPYVGAVQAAGLTAEGLERSIAHEFADRQLLKDPEVLVYVRDYKANPIFIMGEVDNPGEYMMSQQLTLMEAILMAGGIDPGAGRIAYLHRQTPGTATKPQPNRAVESPAVGDVGVEVTRIDLSPLKTGGVPDPDIPLQKGDIVVIPKSEDRRFYVLGDVRSPGTIPIPQPAERVLLVSQAIAHAGGPQPTAKMSDGMLIRYNEADGSREERPVDFLAILKGRQPDFEIQPNDIIYIPSSSGKTMAYSILGVLPMTIQQGAMDSIRSR